MFFLCCCSKLCKLLCLFMKCIIELVKNLYRVESEVKRFRQ